MLPTNSSFKWGKYLGQNLGQIEQAKCRVALQLKRHLIAYHWLFLISFIMFNYIPFVIKHSVYVYKIRWSVEYPTMFGWYIIWWAGLLTGMVAYIQYYFTRNYASWVRGFQWGNSRMLAYLTQHCFLMKKTFLNLYKT